MFGYGRENFWYIYIIQLRSFICSYLAICQQLMMSQIAICDGNFKMLGRTNSLSNNQVHHLHLIGNHTGLAGFPPWFSVEEIGSQCLNQMGFLDHIHDIWCGTVVARTSGSWKWKCHDSVHSNRRVDVQWVLEGESYQCLQYHLWGVPLPIPAGDIRRQRRLIQGFLKTVTLSVLYNSSR